MSHNHFDPVEGREALRASWERSDVALEETLARHKASIARIEGLQQEDGGWDFHRPGTRADTAGLAHRLSLEVSRLQQELATTHAAYERVSVMLTERTEELHQAQADLRIRLLAVQHGL